MELTELEMLVIDTMVHLNTPVLVQWADWTPPTDEEKSVGYWLSTQHVRYPMLSSGEKIVFDIAIAFQNGSFEARVAQLALLSHALRSQMIALVSRWSEEVIGR